MGTSTTSQLSPAIEHPTTAKAGAAATTTLSSSTAMPPTMGIVEEGSDHAETDHDTEIEEVEYNDSARQPEGQSSSEVREQNQRQQNQPHGNEDISIFHSSGDISLSLSELVNSEQSGEGKREGERRRRRSKRSSRTRSDSPRKSSSRKTRSESPRKSSSSSNQNHHRNHHQRRSRRSRSRNKEKKEVHGSGADVGGVFNEYSNDTAADAAILRSLSPTKVKGDRVDELMNFLRKAYESPKRKSRSPSTSGRSRSRSDHNKDQLTTKSVRHRHHRHATSSRSSLHGSSKSHATATTTTTTNSSNLEEEFEEDSWDNGEGGQAPPPPPPPPMSPGTGIYQYDYDTEVPSTPKTPRSRSKSRSQKDSKSPRTSSSKNKRKKDPVSPGDSNHSHNEENIPESPHNNSKESLRSSTSSHRSSSHRSSSHHRRSSHHPTTPKKQKTPTTSIGKGSFQLKTPMSARSLRSGNSSLSRMIIPDIIAPPITSDGSYNRSYVQRPQREFVNALDWKGFSPRAHAKVINSKSIAKAVDDIPTLVHEKSIGGLQSLQPPSQQQQQPFQPLAPPPPQPMTNNASSSDDSSLLMRNSPILSQVREWNKTHVPTRRQAHRQSTVEYHNQKLHVSSSSLRMKDRSIQSLKLLQSLGDDEKNSKYLEKAKQRHAQRRTSDPLKNDHRFRRSSDSNNNSMLLSPGVTVSTTVATTTIGLTPVVV